MSTTIDQIRDLLVQRGTELLDQPYVPVHFTNDLAADALLNDSRWPHAFVLGCLMDRQDRIERCWRVPYEFGQRIGSFEMKTLAGLTNAKVRSIFRQKPALHRLGDVMADVFHAGIQKIAADYGGDASRIWQGKPSSATLVRRFLEFDGVGPKIATMAANILVREMKVPVSDKFSIDVSVDVHVRRVFERLGLVREDASNEEIVYAAREMNPEYPGVFDLVAWEIGRTWCKAGVPECGGCWMGKVCPRAR